MGFNYGYEKKKFDSRWKRLEVEYHRSSDPRYRSGRWSRHLGCHQPAGRLRQRQPRCECLCIVK